MGSHKMHAEVPPVRSLEGVRDLIKDCLRALNNERPADDKIVITDNTPLLTEESQLDSLDFVSLSVDLEERLRMLTGHDVELAPSALAENEHPMRNVGTLAEYILAKLCRN